MKFLFATGMSSTPWGGSEELWSQTARSLTDLGHEVIALVPDWTPRASQIDRLPALGIPLCQYRIHPGILHRAVHSVQRRFLGGSQPSQKRTVMDRCLRSFRPDFVCVSHGAIACGLEFMESCLEHGFPYASISQANSESFWPSDPLAVRLERTYHRAARAFFVSASNLRLFECQIGATLPNAEIVFNPYNVPYDCRTDWPTEDSLTRLACVGRLDPSAKGQDLLLRLLSRLPWSRLPLRVSFFGSGPMAATLKKLATSLGVDPQVDFCGHVADVAGIWRTHHALVLPSRYEGLPLAVVEAMLSGRPVITTDVAGNTDFITDNQTGFVASEPTLERLGDAMTRAWNRRNEWPFIGAAAAAAIRQRIPSDPPFVFAQRLLQLASGGNFFG